MFVLSLGCFVVVDSSILGLFAHDDLVSLVAVSYLASVPHN
jgi:hypothetical protein